MEQKVVKRKVLRNSTNVLAIIILLATSAFIKCSNNVEVPPVDCGLSDLSLAIVGQVNADCAAGGSITVSAQGGTEPYLFSSDGIDFQSSSVLNDLAAGDYTLTVRDADGCSTFINTTLVGESGSIELSISTEHSSCGSDTGSLEVEPSGGTAPYSFTLNGGVSQPSGSFTGLSNGSNSVTVEDSEGCKVTRTVLITTGVSLDADIMPIIDSNCAVTGCHNGSRSPDLRTAAGIINSAARVQARTQAGTMPPTGREDLSQSTIDLIACWVSDGAPNN